MIACAAMCQGCVGLRARVFLRSIRRPDADACDVSVQFGSYAMGIDGRAFDKVQRYVARHPRLIATSSVAGTRTMQATR